VGRISHNVFRCLPLAGIQLIRVTAVLQDSTDCETGWHGDHLAAV
jgi:hypothetical protein